MSGLRTIGAGVRRVPSAAAFTVQRTRGLRALGRRDDEPSRLLFRIIRNALDDRAEPHERVWFERLEAERARLAASEEQLVAHGHEWTGDPDDDRVLVRTVGELCRTTSKPPFWSQLLFRLVRGWSPERALELGTSVGMSAAYAGAALEAAGRGQLITIEAAAARVGVARDALSRLSLLDRVETRHGRFQDALEPALETLGAVDYAFVDGHHDEHATVRYWRAIAPRLAEPAIVVFDDISWSNGMRRAWATIAGDDGVGLALDLNGIGICVVGEGIARAAIRAPLR